MSELPQEHHVMIKGVQSRGACGVLLRVGPDSGKNILTKP
jgi:hypothetical protein